MKLGKKMKIRAFQVKNINILNLVDSVNNGYSNNKKKMIFNKQIKKNLKKNRNSFNFISMNSKIQHLKKLKYSLYLKLNYKISFILNKYNE